MDNILWHNLPPEEIERKLDSSLEKGLSRDGAQARIQKYGLNKLPETKADGIFFIFIRQFKSSLIYILIAASLAIFLMGETVDGFIILAVLIFNAIVGTVQEGKAQNTLLALKKFIETNVTVLRDGKELIIHDSIAVPGDVIILQEGEKVPADARIIFAKDLKIDQSSLTGESEPVHKTADMINKKDISFIEQNNMVFRGTVVVSGNGQAIIIATGLKTIIGGIGKKIAAIDTDMPLKTNIKNLSKLIIWIVLIISILLVFGGFFLESKSLLEMFKIAVALSVSVIPEGLPIVITLILASGVWRMAKKNALIKRLQAVEALGQAKIIAVDKTGTITKNELMVQEVFSTGKFFSVGGSGYSPSGEISAFSPEDKRLKPIIPADEEEIILAGKIAGFCNNARVFYSEEEKKFTISGDPTEAAILVFAQKSGFQKEIIEKEYPILEEIPFNYVNKYRATVRKAGNQKFLSVIGAPETILKMSNLSKEKKEEMENVFQKFSRNGLRVLGFAFNGRPAAGISAGNMPELSFGGFYAMTDTLRPEVKEAMERSSQAGIKVVMITGDHKLTAQAIAKDAGIFKEGDGIITGEEIDEMSEKEFMEKIKSITVFSRVTPEHKFKIIQAYRKLGEVIAMTGDGVNDAPPLVAADLGVAMGKIGTEVAKEASDIILLDDNFGSIISAVEEGRNIYKTIKKVVLYLFSTSAGEVLVIGLALFSGYPLPLLAGQIIWLNFVTDGFLDVALAMEPKESGLLKGKWKKANKYLVDGVMAQRILIMSLVMSIVSFFVFKDYLQFGLPKAMTMSLTTLAVFQWFNALNCRSEEKSIFQMNPFGNKFLIGALAIVFYLQVMAVYNPWFQRILRTVELDISDWLLAFAAGFSIIIVEEARKLFMRNNS